MGEAGSTVQGAGSREQGLQLPAPRFMPFASTCPQRLSARGISSLDAALNFDTMHRLCTRRGK